MPYETQKIESNDGTRRKTVFSISGKSVVTVEQVLSHAADFQPRPPEIGWTSPLSADADYAYAVGLALIEASELCRTWHAKTIKADQQPH